MADVTISFRVRPHQLRGFMRGQSILEKMTLLASIGEAGAKRKAPVKTGNLRRSIYSEAEETVAGIVARYGTNVRYGLFQELGTRFHPAHPYLRPALEDIKEALR